MNITENNKIISEFMGATFERKNIARIRLNVIRGEVRFEDLKFHYDWNWLMEVVEKIESLNMFIIHSSYFNKRSISIKAEHNRNFIHIEIHFKNPNEKKEATYNACVEFIKWYNQQNENP